MKTRLLVRPNPSIPFTDTVYDGGFVALQVDDLTGLNIQSGDTISLEFKDTSLNPQYETVTTVFYTTASNNTITTTLLWGTSGPLNPGSITNVVRTGPYGNYSVTFDPVELDLQEDLQFPLNFNVADIRTPQNRKSNYSKTILLPGTSENSQILAQLFEIDVDSLWDVSRKHSCFVLQDGLEIFNGSIRISTIKRNNWNTVNYEVSLEGELTDFFSALKNPDGTELMLSDLDMSEFAHALIRGNIISTWTGTIQRAGATFQNVPETLIGPVSDTGFASGARTAFIIGSTAASGLEIGDVVRFVMDNPGSTTVNFDASQGHHTIVGFTPDGNPVVNLAFQSGDVNSGQLYICEATGVGYVYPSVTYGQIGSLANYDHYPPGVMINWVPWVYAKTYVDKIFEKVGFSYDSAFFESQFFKRLIVNSTSNFFAPNRIIVDATPFSVDEEDSEVIDFDTEISDVNNQWDPVNLWFTNISGVNDTPVIHIHTEGNALDVETSEIQLRVFRSLDNDGNPDPTWPTGDGFNQDNIGNIMRYTIVDNNGFGSTELIAGPGTTFPTPTSFINDFTIDWLTIRPGEQIRIKIRNAGDNTTTTMFVTAGRLTIDSLVVFKGPVVDMTCKDFLVSLIGAFNLYIEPDRFSANRLIVEPFNDYYLDQFIDWTDKVDISQEIELEPICPTNAKVYKFTYDEDSDYLNQDYKADTARLYGDKLKTVDTEFSQQTIETRLKFAPTPLSDITAVTDSDPQTAEFILPAIYKDMQRNPPTQIKPRLMYWTGIRRTDALGGFRLSTDATSGPDKDTRNDFGVSMYSYAGHLDNPLDATLDLNFDLLKQYYYGQTYPFLVTDNTLYERYWKDYIRELTDKSSRFVRMYLELSSVDITTLSFRKLYFIKGNYLRLQKIADYNPITGKPALCEFVKVDVNRTINGNLPPEPCFPEPIEAQYLVTDQADLDALCFANGYVAGTNAVVRTGEFEGYLRTLVSGTANFSSVAGPSGTWYRAGADYEAALAGNGFFTVDGVSHSDAYQEVLVITQTAGTTSGVTPILVNATPGTTGGSTAGMLLLIGSAIPTEIDDLARNVEIYSCSSQNGDYTSTGVTMTEQQFISIGQELADTNYYRLRYYNDSCDYGYSRASFPTA